MKMNKKGFTLIELLVVVLIIGILAAIALPQYFKAVEKAKAAEALSIISSIYGAEQRYYMVREGWTTKIGELDVEFDGTTSTASSFTTNNYTVTLQSNRVRLDRPGGRFPHTLARSYTETKIRCNDNSNGICGSLGNFDTLTN